MSKPILVCDFDDVIVPTLQCAIDIYNKDKSTNLIVQDFKEWDVNKVAPDFSKYFYKIDFTKVEEKNGAINYLKRLSRKYEIIIATASHVDKFKEKEIWIKENLPFIKYSNVMCVRNKSILKGSVIIDDGVHNFEGDFEHKFLYTTPANMSSNFDSKIIRVFCLQDVCEILGV